MHLVESYALNTGLKIGKPHVLDKFYPLAFDGDYITLQPFSKYSSKAYDYWNEVTQILATSFFEKHIRVIQLGLKEEPKIWGTYDYRGKTDFNQAAYLIKNSILHLGTDSFGVHMASGFNKKIVALYNIMYPSQCGPYWSDNKDVILLEPEREKNEKPSYSAEEKPKSINRIKPEVIAKSVCELLGIEIDFPFESIKVGKQYNTKKIEVIPKEKPPNLQKFKIDSMIMRMDIEFNESVLYGQLLESKCSIVTEKPINIDILKEFREKITEFVFIINGDEHLDYLKKVKDQGIKVFIISEMEEKDLNKLKLKLLDFGGTVQRKKIKSVDEIKELKGRDLEHLFYRSSSFNVFGESLYMCKDTSFNSHPIEDMANPPLLQVVDSPKFWQDIDHYIIYEKIA